MKRIILFVAILIAAAIELQAQIPNNGFELWTTSGDCLRPEGWASANDWKGLTKNCYSISRSSDHYPVSIGNFSIKIENRASILPDTGAAGMVWTGKINGFGTDHPVFPVIGHPTSLCGYYKFLPENGDAMDIHFVFYNKGEEIAGGKMIVYNAVNVWTAFNIPVSYPEYEAADSARIMMSCFDADNFLTLLGNSVMYVDNLSFDELITATDVCPSGNSKFNLYPNPANSHFILDLNKTHKEEIRLEIYNAIGVLVTSELVKPGRQVVNVDLRNGVYMVCIKAPDISGVQKLVIQR